MAEEHSRVVRPPVSDKCEPSDTVLEDEELLEELDALEDLGVDASPSRTSEDRLPPAPSARSSAPPPVPAHTRSSQTASALPPPRGSSEIATGITNAGEMPGSRPSSHSGMFRIDRPSSAPTASSAYVSLPPSVPAAWSSAPPPPPTGASEPADLKRAVATLSKESREQAGHIHRLRLMVRLREDRIAELEAALRAQRVRVTALEQELSSQHSQRLADDLTRISGIGPGFERALHALGITSFLQIADWTPADVERVAREIRTTPRRITRDRWVEHARALVAAQDPGR